MDSGENYYGHFLGEKSATPDGPPDGASFGQGQHPGTFSHELYLLPSSSTSLFLEFIGDPAAPAWQGHLIAVLMFIAACLQTLFEQQHMYRLKVLQIRLRTAITGLVYRKVSPGDRCGLFPSLHPVAVYMKMLWPGSVTSLNYSCNLCLKTLSFINSLIVAYVLSHFCTALCDLTLGLLRPHHITRLSLSCSPTPAPNTSSAP